MSLILFLQMIYEIIILIFLKKKENILLQCTGQMNLLNYLVLKLMTKY